jgi:hypothetical protein
MVEEFTFILFMPNFKIPKPLDLDISKVSKNENNLYIGNITFFIDKDENDANKSTVSVGYLNVNDKKNDNGEPVYQGKGFGKLLMNIMFVHLQSLKKHNISEIYLDDCSDKESTKDSIYFKIGFRIPNANNRGEMRLYINKEITNAEKAKFHIYERNTIAPDLPEISSLHELLNGLVNINFAAKGITWDQLKSYQIIKLVDGKISKISECKISQIIKQIKLIVPIIYNEKCCNKRKSPNS